MSDLDAYAVDCLVRGTVEVGEGRLSDQLEGVSTLLIQAVQLEDLTDGHVVSMPSLEVQCDELCAIVARGQRGDATRRLHTRTTHVKVEVGPYLIDGTVHGTPASEPIGMALRRTGWVPLTEATVMYRRGSEEVSEEVETLLINRHLINSMWAADKKQGHLEEPGANAVPAGAGTTEPPPEDPASAS